MKKYSETHPSNARRAYVSPTMRIVVLKQRYRLLEQSYTGRPSANYMSNPTFDEE